MPKIQEIIYQLEQWAPPIWQESYDNSGLLTGNPSQEIQGILITLDCTEEVVQEAITKGCNMIIAHHPIIFKGLKSLTGKNYVERTIIDAIKNDVAIYAIHTNLDHVHTGVNAKICQLLGLERTAILAPKSDALMKLVTFVPQDQTDRVLEALHQAGAGQIGNYSHCSFRVPGMGAFLPNDHANPTIGQARQLEKVPEDRLEVLVPVHAKYEILSALKATHPYEEVAYYLQPIANTHQEVGAGMTGYLPEPMPEVEFLQMVKEKMGPACIKHTPLREKKIKKVAVCGGAGSFLINKAIASKADIYITSDIKYHEFFEADKHIVVADIGHYESEQFTKELIFEYLTKKFSTFAFYLSETQTNPIRYF
jgi:dinuclear metal center YbgI/SA1388 family protein